MINHFLVLFREGFGELVHWSYQINLNWKNKPVVQYHIEIIPVYTSDILSTVSYGGVS